MRRNSFDEERRLRQREARIRGVEPRLDVRALADKLRLGEIDPFRVVLAALLGNETASEASGVRPNRHLSSGFSRSGVSGGGGLGWVLGFTTRAPEIVMDSAIGLPSGTSRLDDRPNVGIWLAAYSSFVSFDLMERPGFDVPRERERIRGGVRTRIMDAVDETLSIAGAVRGLIQSALDGEPPVRSTVDQLGNRSNELWEEARWLHENGELEGSGVEDLWDVASDLYVLISVLRTRQSGSLARTTSNLLESAASIWTRGDRPNDEDWAEVSQRVIARMILELIPDLGRRSR